MKVRGKKPLRPCNSMKSILFNRRPAFVCFNLIVSLVCAIAAVNRAQGQVNFPDPNLENAVRNTLQISSPTPIYPSNMLTLTNLPASGYGITNLTGLNTASNLLILDVSFNQVSNLS